MPRDFFLKNKQRESVLHWLERGSVVVTICAALTVAFYAEKANFTLLFSLFAGAAALMTLALYVKEQWSQMYLQGAMILINLFALIKYVLGH